MPAHYIHRPWKADEDVLRAAGVVLGQSYPLPVVEHRPAREESLKTARERFGRTDRDARAEGSPARAR